LQLFALSPSETSEPKAYHAAHGEATKKRSRTALRDEVDE